MGRPRDLEKHRYWGAQIRAWQRSGLTQAEFCRRQEIGRRLFRSWKRRLEVGQPEQEAPARFVAVTVRREPEVNTMRPPVTAALTVVTGSGYRIEVGDGFTPATLTSLLATLGGA
jgi:hypothetical protein